MKGISFGINNGRGEISIGRDVCVWKRDTFREVCIGTNDGIVSKASTVTNFTIFTNPYIILFLFAR